MENKIEAIVGYKPYVSHWQVLMDKYEQTKSSGKVIGHEMTAEELFQEAIRYFKWCDDHPIARGELIRSGKQTGSVYTANIPRPYSIQGLCIHIGVTKEYLHDVTSSDVKNDFYFVVSSLIAIIHTQNTELAMIDVYNPIIVSKVLGFDRETKQPQGSGMISISVDGSAPPLLENENDVETTKSEIQNSEK